MIQAWKFIERLSTNCRCLPHAHTTRSPVGILFSKASYSEGEELPLPDSLWSAWTFISDPGTHADVVSFGPLFLT